MSNVSGPMRLLRFLPIYLILMTPMTHAFDLIKCNSQKHGTLWASFGQVTRSGEASRFFPTEVVIFGPDSVFRKVYSLAEGTQMPVVSRPGFIRLEYVTSEETGSKTHTLQLLQYEPDYAKSFMGNWTVKEPNKPDLYDLVGCTVD